MMVNSSIDLAVWREQLLRERGALDKVIESVEQAMGATLPDAARSGANLGIVGQPGDGLTAQIKRYLTTAQTKHETSAEIAKALVAAGVRSVSDNFVSVVAATLTRLQKSGVAKRYEDGWGLVERHREASRVA